MHGRTRRLCGGFLSIAAIFATISTAPLESGSARAVSACPAAAARASSVSWGALRSATLCLLNRERAERGLRPLRLNRRLSRAAGSHGRDMVRNRYFAHDSRSGASFVTRLRRTGYVHPRSRWLVGENLAWGSQDLSPPRAIVRSWMHSPDHRDNILEGRFREIGIAVVDGAPVSERWAQAATYVTEFGVIRG
jgi:uncharacterized protein YkwD